MDEISGLPDDVLVKILSLVPTKFAISTSILSKRWKFLWMWLPKLDYSGRDESLSTQTTLRDFIYKTLPLHRAPVIESLRLDLCELYYPYIKPQDIKFWIGIAVSRYVRELEIIFFCSKSRSQDIFPSCLFTCSTLVILKLRYVTLLNVPSMVCLSSLKTLLLEEVVYEDKKTLQELLSICPVLEDLEVRFCDDDDMQSFTIIVPSLQKLSLYLSNHCGFLDGYEIDTPSLKYLKLNDWNECPSLFKNMPELKEAYIDVVYFNLKSVIGSITSVKRLTICSEDVYGDDLVFDQLEHLELCICKDNSSNLLAHMLKVSPNLRVLDICELDLHGDLKTNTMVSWNQPSSVPECLLSNLQIFNWGPYFGRPQDREIVVYVLKNARYLKTVTIVAVADSCEHGDVSSLEMIKELTLSSRASSSCELVFVD